MWVRVKGFRERNDNDENDNKATNTMAIKGKERRKRV